ncbi:MAG: Jag N-terminal domain-containing protein [Desulfatitalea sp.]|nr:Jag N-terminal domain-containing protein [Desulfatitalea sp.]MBI5896713.1 Jag N-terminal domain-containing protein [Desulfobacterales bacterium]
MNEYVEFEGKNVQKALEKAGQELNRAVEKLEYDVVSHGSSGIFGFVGVKKAKIRVKTNGAESQIQEDAREQARSLVDKTFDDEESEETEEGAPAEIAPVDMEQAISDGKAALQRIVDFISEGSRIEAEKRNGRILFKVEGGNSALLIGKRGQTLEAIQYLVEKIINKKNETRIRVMVDVEGYLGARKSNLQKLASKLADKAKKISKPVTIGQMNAYDRRIVHLHLKDNQEVRTQSVGEGYYRKLVIFPKRRRRGKS